MASSGGSWACDKCHRLLNPCTIWQVDIFMEFKSLFKIMLYISHQTVKGLYVWCQGCNHGGHLAHMRDWFAKEKSCATGCGHTCVLQPLLTSED
jgi:hypothetical protein